MLRVGDSLGMCMYGYEGTVANAGQFQAFTPKFVKKYADVAGVVTGAMRSCVLDVKKGTVPADEHGIHMLAGEKPKWEAVMRRHAT